MALGGGAPRCFPVAKASPKPRFFKQSDSQNAPCFCPRSSGSINRFGKIPTAQSAVHFRYAPSSQLASAFIVIYCFRRSVDDLRPELGAYGITAPGSPHVDALASEGLVFERAYAQQAVCGPSRNSFLSGRRPDTTKTYTFQNSFRDVGPNWTSMLGFLKNKGYTVAGQGRLFLTIDQ